MVLFDLDFLKVVTHSLHLGKLDFAVAALRQVLHKRVQRLLHESILQALVLALLAEQVARDFLGFSHSAVLQLEQLGPIVAIFVSFATGNKLS